MTQPGPGHPEQEIFIGAQWSDKVKCPPRRCCPNLFAHCWPCDVMSQDQVKHQSHNITTGQIICIFAMVNFNKKHKTAHTRTSHMINGTIKLNLNWLKWRSKLCDLMMIFKVINSVGRVTMSNNELRLSWSTSDTEKIHQTQVTMPMCQCDKGFP